MQVEVGEGAWKVQEYKSKQGQRYDALAAEMRMRMARRAVVEEDRALEGAADDFEWVRSGGRGGAGDKRNRASNLGGGLWGSIQNLWSSGEDEEERIRGLAVKTGGEVVPDDEDEEVDLEEESLKKEREEEERKALARRLREVAPSFSDEDVDFEIAKRRDKSLRRAGAQKALSATAKSPPTPLGSFKGWGKSGREVVELLFPSLADASVESSSEGKLGDIDALETVQFLAPSLREEIVEAALLEWQRHVAKAGKGGNQQGRKKRR